VDYLARLCLASNSWRWFIGHVFELAIVLLPLLRSLTSTSCIKIFDN